MTTIDQLAAVTSLLSLGAEAGTQTWTETKLQDTSFIYNDTFGQFSIKYRGAKVSS